LILGRPGLHRVVGPPGAIKVTVTMMTMMRMRMRMRVRVGSLVGRGGE
jgi:hypothetical protein